MRLKQHLSALAAGSLLFAAFHTQADAGPIRIGLTCPFTGGSAPMGESLRNAARLAV